MTFSLNKLLQWLILTLLFPLVFLNGWLVFHIFHYFQPLVTIFILATLLAFILNYPVSLLEQRGVKQNYAVGLVFVLSLVILIGLGITVVPVVLQQFHEMGKLLPEWIDSSEQKLFLLNNWTANHGLKVNLNQLMAQITNRLPNEFEHLADTLFSLLLETIDSISEALITLVLTFYLLLDGGRVWQGLFKRLPWSFSQQIQQSLQQNFQNYLIGQVALALLMGFSQTLMFLVFKVPFGLLFGLGIGIMSLIPFGDVISLAIIILIIASHDFWLATKVLVAAVVIDQLIDQAIAPRLLGSFTGIRPIWVVISLLVGTYLGGVLGLLIAVPVTAVIKDLLDKWSSIPSEGDNTAENSQANDTNVITSYPQP
ncbi:AI-2E family transporter [Aetokthonos hydrillicola Thurmond2011]|jgi:predicted PurR-regulated permease PerM|uniref:AI-2E family transporter n=1 Tax=Aetokthonos hydrillicola Thurmond2011 TaxID=2712845 RepID=A0AAP5I829_9CYAN|nr:AI-2E family transporter [Aetokthonos hydrillicola]MBO3460583.1 AI-2E family transporter [Aetokthonos hydrillicola CCALA 1050]MBW4585289.1 AI-2E family transporter [Aetokthonos hydrillicola CCALA 1050]MDR9896576.1 AI-2E family transporter [Aetokthonos hydrillicola Thurmond2011]